MQQRPIRGVQMMPKMADTQSGTGHAGLHSEAETAGNNKWDVYVYYYFLKSQWSAPLVSVFSPNPQQPYH